MLLKNEPLADKTTIKIGGIAQLFFLPSCLEEVEELLPLLTQDFPLYYLGGGSNTIFGKFKGVVVSSQSLRGFRVLEEDSEGILLEVLAGTLLKELIPLIFEKNLCGIETLLGIPRISVGGAVAMNAGAYGKEISQITEGVYYFDPLKGEFLLERKPRFGYRSSDFPQKGFICKVLLRLKPCPSPIRELVKKLNSRRRKSQPLELPTAGSTFKNPKGNFAGKLLEEVGLKGFCTKKGLCFSRKHANFLVNLSRKATLGDVLKLIDLAKERVLKEYDLWLEEEVKIVSTDG
ncbi:MAG TPA: UDP-N-acetylmuramate dehydrogenase [Aquifex aeolicus]|nr:UDP-N-acetylmuramate dehydrogenase [Aquificales bacterium]HIQ25972.1 UDP-N-acetylmuramate dehydrogenase [Aquifex aeolicus]